MKNDKNYLYVKKLLILSAYINLVLGPVNRHQIKYHKFEVFTRNGLHFIHPNINSLLTKIDELRYIAKKIQCSSIDISETKLDNTVYDSEFAIHGYNIVRIDRNITDGRVVCYIRNNVCFNLKICLSNSINKICSLLYCFQKQNQLQ